MELFEDENFFFFLFPKNPVEVSIRFRNIVRNSFVVLKDYRRFLNIAREFFWDFKDSEGFLIIVGKSLEILKNSLGSLYAVSSSLLGILWDFHRFSGTLGWGERGEERRGVTISTWLTLISRRSIWSRLDPNWDQDKDLEVSGLFCSWSSSQLRWLLESRRSMLMISY